MEESQFNLLKKSRFLPLFLTQFLGAFNDNIFKNALIILIVYRLASDAVNEQMLITFAAGIFILPFFLFSAPAGQLADKFEKSRLIRIIKFFEILIMLMATLGFLEGSVNLLLVSLFLMGTQSAFFGPLKYSILPDLLSKKELIGGNALISTGTFLSILIGTIAGGLLIILKNGPVIISLAIISMAILGLICSYFIPTAGPAEPTLKFHPNIAKETWHIIQHARENKKVFLSILGISWFWLIGATFLAQFPNFAKDILGVQAQVVTFFLTLFSIGIGVGALLCNKLLRHEINAKYVPLGVLGITIFILDFYFASRHNIVLSGQPLLSFNNFLSSWNHWRISCDAFFIAVCSGIYVVPLYAIVQSRSPKSRRARIIAANNILNALFMVIAASGTMLMFVMHFSVLQVFLTIAIINAFVAIYICKLLPNTVVKVFFRWLFILLYRVKVKGFENYEAGGERMVIIANHSSLLDGLLISSFLPNKLLFAVNTNIMKRWWVKPWMALIEAFPLDPMHPFKLKTLINTIKENKKCVIFPEGRITMTGSLMKIYEGPGLISDKAKATLLPIHIQGAQYTHFSHLKGKIRPRLFPKITLTIFPPTRLEIPADIRGRKRRLVIGTKLYRLMTDMTFAGSNYHKTLLHALIEAKKLYGANHIIMEDAYRQPITYRYLIRNSFVLGKKIKPLTELNEHVGLLLPNMNSTLIVFFGLHAYGRIPAMLNYSAGVKNILYACQAANIRTVFTSYRFTEMGRLTNIVDALLSKNITIHYLEDIVKNVNAFDKCFGLFANTFPVFTYKKTMRRHEPSSPAVVLFTSGSEGIPKGVVLSHENIQANLFQLGSRVDFNARDIIFNSMPIFHAFGLTGGTLLPMLSGIKIFLYPSPLHYRIVPELIYDTNSTIFFGTDTFLAGYARYAHPYDFYSVRYIFAGAERLKPSTRDIYLEKFGTRIFEGYGTTETSPTLSTNTPIQHRFGTVGRLLPGIQHRVEKVTGITKGGRLHVNGPNVMLGYLRVENPGELMAPPNGWHDTGDIVEFDDDGFITIQGRAKRFAKIAGEMVSLAAAENYLNDLWPDYHHAIMSEPDERKGEQLILVTSYSKANRKDIVKYFRENGIAEFYIPKKIIVVKKVPLLKTGKTDYLSVKTLLAGH